MMKTSALTIVLSAVLILFAGCGSESNEADAPRKETVFDPLVGTLDRAKSVEQLPEEHKARLDEQIQESEN